MFSTVCLQKSLFLLYINQHVSTSHPGDVSYCVKRDLKKIKKKEMHNILKKRTLHILNNSAPRHKHNATLTAEKLQPKQCSSVFYITRDELHTSHSIQDLERKSK